MEQFWELSVSPSQLGEWMVDQLVKMPSLQKTLRPLNIAGGSVPLEMVSRAWFSVEVIIRSLPNIQPSQTLASRSMCWENVAAS